MLITFSKFKKKNNEFYIKGIGRNTREILMTIYAMACRLQYDVEEFKSVEDVFKACLELEKDIIGVEEK